MIEHPEVGGMSYGVKADVFPNEMNSFMLCHVAKRQAVF
jgi:hypothetical protein